MRYLSVTPDHYEYVLYNIYRQGPDKSFSDVALKYGDSVFHGHKCVLSTQSEYFNALFQGNFSDSNASEIDLSSVFEDELSFQSVMRFFYTGVIHFVDIFLLARYASFFQMKSLKKLCECDMMERVGLKNCIKYFIFSKSADYNPIEEMTTEIIQRRFHDYLIHEDDTLQLCPSDLQELLNIDCLTYSSACDILEFISKWVLLDFTTQRIEVGLYVLDYLKERENNLEDRIGGPIKPCVKSCCCQLEAELKVSPDLEKNITRLFIQTFKSIMELLAKSQVALSEETVLITLSKRKKLDLSIFEEAGDETPIEHFVTGKHTDWDSVYDVCLYRPSTKVWYTMESIENKPCYDDEEFIPKSSRLLPFDKQSCELNYIHGQLMFSSRLSNKILIYNCKEKNWKSLVAETKAQTKCRTQKRDLSIIGQRDLSIIGQRDLSIIGQRDLSIIGHHVFVWNEKTFVIKVKVKSYSSEFYGYRYSSDSDEGNADIYEVYFEIYKMNELSGRLTLKVRSPGQFYEHNRSISQMKRYEGLRSFLVAKASKSMDEILVVCLLSDDTDRIIYTFIRTEKCMSFVANIKDKSVHFFPRETCDKLPYQPGELFIVDDTDGFFVAVNTDIEEDTCHVIGSYKYLSQDLKLVEGLSDPPNRQMGTDGKVDYPFKERYLPTLTGTSSLWYIYGCFLYNNDFQNVKFHKSEDGQYESTPTELTPHPFTTLVAAVETKMKADILKNLQPSCFLG